MPNPATHRFNVRGARFVDPQVESRYRNEKLAAAQPALAYFLAVCCAISFFASVLDFVRIPARLLPLTLGVRVLSCTLLGSASWLLLRRSTKNVASKAPPLQPKTVDRWYGVSTSVSLAAYGAMAWAYLQVTGTSPYQAVVMTAVATIVMVAPGPPAQSWPIALVGVGIHLGLGAAQDLAFTQLLREMIVYLAGCSVALGAARALQSQSRRAFATAELLAASQKELRRLTEAETSSAQRALRRKNEEWEAIVGNGQLLVLLLDECGVIQFANAPAQLAKITEGTLLAQWVESEEIATELETSLRPVIEEGRSADIELARQHGEAHQTFAFRAAPIGKHPPHDRVSMVGLDVTESRRVYTELAQAQKLNSMGALVGGIAHDFNNLLHVIAASAELLEMEPLEPEQQQLVSSVTDAAESAGKLTHELLLFCRSKPVRSASAAPNALVIRTAKLLERLLDPSVHLELTLDANVSPVRADPSHVEQVIMNLVVNARDAMPDGGLIELTTRALHDGTELEVKDNGSGMSKELQLKIFEPLFTTKPPGQGTGLGLATVRGVVERMSGRIEVESTVGQGSSFRVWMPAGSAERSSGRELDITGLSRKVLAVDDDPRALQVSVAMLARAGYEVFEANDMASALAVVQRTPDLDAVLADVQLQDTTGPQVVKAIRALVADVAVVYASGFVADAELLQAVEHGKELLIDKPFSSRELKTTLRTALASRGKLASVGRDSERSV